MRKFKGSDNCQISVGIDGAEKMIKKAQSIDSINDYICANILNWAPSHLFNIIHSREVLYYLENPSELINTIYTKWLDQTGCFIFGIDHYTENLPSINWPSECGINMNTQPIDYWLTIMREAGFKNIKHWQCYVKNEWKGTLVIMGEK